MANGRDDRNVRSKDGSGHGFLIEGPEILDRSPAAADDDHVDVVPGVEITNPRGDFLRRPCSLNFRGINQDMQRRIAPFQNSEHVPDCGPCWRRHYADFLRQEGELFLSLLPEKAFLAELFLFAAQAL